MVYYVYHPMVAFRSCIEHTPVGVHGELVQYMFHPLFHIHVHVLKRNSCKCELLVFTLQDY